jgi:hypothetical protein
MRDQDDPPILNYTNAAPPPPPPERSFTPNLRVADNLIQLGGLFIGAASGGLVAVIANVSFVGLVLAGGIVGMLAAGVILNFSRPRPQNGHSGISGKQIREKGPRT